MKSKALNIIFFLVIVLTNCIVYFPALSHVGRADQIIYLIDTSRFDDLSSRILNTYSYPRSRELTTGDEILFRPVLFIFLAIEKWLFGYNFVYWQAMGVILHLMLLWQTIRIMHLVGKNPFSFFFVLNFSVLFISQEMVIWHAINGYLVFLIFLMGAYYHLIKYLHGELSNRKELLLIAGYLTMACFTFEFGLICTVVFYMMVLAKKCSMCREDKKGDHLVSLFPEPVLIIPVVIYILVSSGDYILRLGWHCPIMQKTSPFFTAQYFFNSISVFIQSVLSPAFLMITAEERSSIHTLPWQNVLLSYGSYGFWQTLNWGVFLASVALTVYFLNGVVKHWVKNKTVKK